MIQPCFCASEGMFSFGGFTLLATLPLMFAGIRLADTVCAIIMLVGWLAAFLIPPAILVRKRRSDRGLSSMLFMQSVFSMLQAAMGILVILGKSC